MAAFRQDVNPSEERAYRPRPTNWGTSDALDWVRAGLGVVGLFVALAVAVAILAFSSAYALKNVNLADPNQSAVLAAASLVGLLPLVAGPILASMGGFWAGTRTRDGSQGALGGALGAFFGVLALAILTAIGFAIGANAAGVDLANVAWPAGLYLRPGWTTTVGYFGTVAGIVYMVACLLAAGIAGSIAGALYTPYETREGYAPRRAPGYRRMPRI
jgi:hypothetical protein